MKVVLGFLFVTANRYLSTRNYIEIQQERNKRNDQGLCSSVFNVDFEHPIFTPCILSIHVTPWRKTCSKLKAGHQENDTLRFLMSFW